MGAGTGAGSVVYGGCAKGLMLKTKMHALMFNTTLAMNHTKSWFLNEKSLFKDTYS